MPRISLFSNNFPDHFIIDQDSFANIATINNDADRGNATFEWTGPNLRIGEPGQLLRAIDPLGFVLPVAPFDSFRIHVKFFSGITDPAVTAEVLEDSTFELARGLIDPVQFSFRSTKFPDRFIRHRGFQLFVEPVNTPDDFQSATFRIALPLLASGPPG